MDQATALPAEPAPERYGRRLCGNCHVWVRDPDYKPWGWCTFGLDRTHRLEGRQTTDQNSCSEHVVPPPPKKEEAKA